MTASSLANCQAACRKYRWWSPPTAGNPTILPSSGGRISLGCGARNDLRTGVRYLKHRHPGDVVRNVSARQPEPVVPPERPPRPGEPVTPGSPPQGPPHEPPGTPVHPPHDPPVPFPGPPDIPPEGPPHPAQPPEVPPEPLPGEPTAPPEAPPAAPPEITPPGGPSVGNVPATRGDFDAAAKAPGIRVVDHPGQEEEIACLLPRRC
jgi:hypothetical protein